MVIITESIILTLRVGLLIYFLEKDIDNEKIVITYGTFDLFHVGHVRLLKRLRALGDSLIVGISSDEFNAMKGKNHSFLMKKERRYCYLVNM